ncbi:MAG: hypothetical protein N3D10_02925 [Candidatus Micrarchaeota archaeon]|nr:hypothetical protein [Candidatus Micrarchaeota archaeon]
MSFKQIEQNRQNRRDFLKVSAIAASGIFVAKFLGGCKNLLEDLDNLSTNVVAREKLCIGQEKHLYIYDIKFKLEKIIPLAQIIGYDKDIYSFGPIAIIKPTKLEPLYHLYRVGFKNDPEAGVYVNYCFYDFFSCWVKKDALKNFKNLPILEMGLIISEQEIKNIPPEITFPPTFPHYELTALEVVYDNKNYSNSYVILDLKQKFIIR